MSNVSKLFENLMTYNEANSQPTKTVYENDSTLLNLTVEIPSELEDITPEDVKVDVGVMAIDTDGAEDTQDDENETDEESNDDSEDVTPEDETESSESENEDEKEEKEEKPNKEEALILRKEAIRKKRLEAKQLREAKVDCTGEEDCECESCKTKKESSDVETAKNNIRKRVNNVSECNDTEIKKEALMHLDTKSLNKLMTEFVRENYKNIDKITITKAMLENRTLKLEGIITNMNGETEKMSITNIGFSASKLEGKRFVMDFKDTSNTFNVIKENLKRPFVFTCTLIEGVLKFEELKYSYKTMHESKVAKVYGNCVLTESKNVVTENANQIKKFNEIIDKIKAAKNANDLTACKDEMDDSNIGDTLLSAAQMVWDDMNSRMVGEIKNEGIFGKKKNSSGKKMSTKDALSAIEKAAKSNGVDGAQLTKIKRNIPGSELTKIINSDDFDFNKITYVSVTGNTLDLRDKYGADVEIHML